MNYNQSSPIAADPADRFARALTQRLSEGTVQALPHDIVERLRVARERAVAQRRLPPVAAHALQRNGGHSAALTGGWWPRLGALVPLVALVAGLITISLVQDERRADELAEVDAALLTDDLPTAAYTDPGFAQFLQSRTSVSH